MAGSATAVRPTIFKGMGPASRRVPETRGKRRVPPGTVVVSADNHWSISEDIFYEGFPKHLRDAAPKLYRSPEGGYLFVDKITGGRIPREYIQPTNQGMQSALENGVLAGYPTVNVIATLVDGQYHDVDSSEMAFKIAGQMAFKKAAEMAKPVLLEPIMGVEVVTPDEYMGDVMGDLSSRRGRIEGMEARGNTQVVRAQVPLSEMFGYSTDLRSRTQGRATYTMQFDSYQEVPQAIASDIVKRVRGE